VGANEAIVFPNPNTGAALLHYLDPEAFQRLGPPRLINGFVFFGFPKDLTASVDSGVVPVHALCLGLPPAASLDAKGLARLRKQRRVWLAHMDSINYFHEPVSAFSSVGISAGALAEAFPGVYRLMPQR
jgi:hypothetical protein